MAFRVLLGASVPSRSRVGRSDSHLTSVAYGARRAAIGPHSGIAVVILSPSVEFCMHRWASCMYGGISRQSTESPRKGDGVTMSRRQKVMKGVIANLQQMKARGELDQQQAEEMEVAIMQMQHGAITQNRREILKAIERLVSIMLKNP